METDKLIKATRIAIQIALANERQAFRKLEIAEEELQQKRDEIKSKLKKEDFLVGGQAKIDANKDGKISGVDFEMMGANRKKYGGKITYKMAGGKVVDSRYD